MLHEAMVCTVITNKKQKGFSVTLCLIVSIYLMFTIAVFSIFNQYVNRTNDESPALFIPLKPIIGPVYALKAQHTKAGNSSVVNNNIIQNVEVPQWFIKKRNNILKSITNNDETEITVRHRLTQILIQFCKFLYIHDAIFFISEGTLINIARWGYIITDDDIDVNLFIDNKNESQTHINQSISYWIDIISQFEYFDNEIPCQFGWTPNLLKCKLVLTESDRNNQRMKNFVSEKLTYLIDIHFSYDANSNDCNSEPWMTNIDCNLIIFPLIPCLIDTVSMNVCPKNSYQLITQWMDKVSGSNPIATRKNISNVSLAKCYGDGPVILPNVAMYVKCM